MSKKPDLELYIDDLDCVVSDPLRFKRKLRIGEDAYASLRLKNGVQGLWDVGGIAMTGASVAASPLVAGSLFASTAGMFSAIGIGAAAATPVGWVIAAAVATGGAYYGMTRLVRTRTGQMIDTIPRFINTPIDLLGMQLFDMVGALAVRVASIDGKVAPAERTTIERHFIDEWGYDQTYTSRALDVLIEGAEATRVKDIAKSLAEFQAKSPDCNADAMQSELMTLLREVVEADGVLDEREELAIDAIISVFKLEKAITFDKLSRSVSDLSEQAGSAVGGLKKRLALPEKLPRLGKKT
ncbi:TerB family tellurite resistance protein [Brevundimonas sp.]|uniref:tellurite resistance TerB family protein n=1 Tax=Brevundimonas sp. TaxID=1871086 RepID=UPI002899C45A|nr:TerB family tellurite resistance protein [Brevundimonas sp.]